ncbi:hypothetical protein G6702_01730 [Polynucleobacter paneuropaeus]|nr:hypothetical protein G6702_01730 [Polynucleobacter paneuropaeus]
MNTKKPDVDRKKKAILIATYNRTEELQSALEHIQACQDFEDHYLVLIYHSEILETARYVENLSCANFIRIATNGTLRSKLENINKNRIDGLDYCFETLEVDYVVAIEDDVLCGYDTLIFCQQMIKKYGKNPEFRGVNLGSKEIYAENRRNEYGLFRYGLFGQGSAITKQVWKKIKSLKLLRQIDKQGFDYLVENFYKSGFVIMPRCSRYIDIGWRGTHAPKDPNNEYYLSLKSSWISTVPWGRIDYYSARFPYTWRYDCFPYYVKDNFKYKLKFEAYRIKIKMKELIKFREYL